MRLKTYHSYILARDHKRCVQCWLTGTLTTKRLHVHHIKTKGSGGKDGYCNLITLCAFHHLQIAHGPNPKLNRQLYQEYTKNFTPPSFWSEVMAFSIIKKEKEKEKIPKPEKSQYQIHKEWFVKKYGMTPEKYKYQKAKERKKALNQTGN